MTANNFMNVALYIKQIPNGLEFQAKALYLLASPNTPEPARIEATERAQAAAPPRLAKAMRVEAQAELMRRTGCDLKTARKHIKQAIGHHDQIHLKRRRSSRH